MTAPSSSTGSIKSNVDDGVGDFSHLFVFSGSNKAGMQMIDKKKQAEVIYESSKNSSYFKHALAQDKKTDEKIRLMHEKLLSLDEEKMRVIKLNIKRDTNRLEAKRNFSKICCVLDMDMFFAACEIRDRPELRDMPVAVGGLGMISTANYVARKFGVRSAMPGFIAKKLCPSLIFVEPNFEKYSQVSELMKAVIRDYDEDFSSHSCDEVYLDLTPAACRLLLYCQDHQSVDILNLDAMQTVLERVVEEDFERQILPSVPCFLENTSIKVLRIASRAVLGKIRRRVKAATGGLTCSAGIGNNFMLAKIAGYIIYYHTCSLIFTVLLSSFLLCSADINKPDGQHEIGSSQTDVVEFIRQLPTRKVGGIGKVMEKILLAFNMTTMGNVFDSLHIISVLFGRKTCEFLHYSSMGLTSEEVSRQVTRVVKGTSPVFSKMKRRHGKEDDSDYSNSDISNEDDDDDHSLVNISKIEESRIKHQHERKSMGVERSFSAISSLVEQRARLQDLCNQLQEDLKSECLFAKKITLKLKNDEFDLITRTTRPVSKVLQLASDFYPLVDELLLAEQPITVRLIGVSASHFVDNLQTSSLAKFLGSKSTEPVLSDTKTACVVCPICNKNLVGLTLAINKHLDECLLHVHDHEPAPIIIPESSHGKSLLSESSITTLGSTGFISCPSGFDIEIWSELPEDIQKEFSSANRSPLRITTDRGHAGSESGQKGKSFHHLSKNRSKRLKNSTMDDSSHVGSRRLPSIKSFFHQNNEK
jgi:nucleotidyltransferase/DNA polymerase involved in DNA repair